MTNGGELRPYQEDALESIGRTQGPYKSLVMPTGSGKTRVALSYAQELIEDGRSVAYITNTDAHAEQVIREAELIGADVAQIRGRRSVERGEGSIDDRNMDIEDYDIGFHIGLFSYYGYFQGSGVPRAQHLIIDDAHAAVAQELTYSAVEINRNEWGRRFDDLINLIEETYPLLADKISGLRYPVHREGGAVLVPPPSNENAKEAIIERISTLSGGTGYQRFLLGQRLEASPEFINWPCVITSNSICWRPFVLPFEAAGQPPHGSIEEDELLLLTSTTESNDFLQIRLGLSEEVNQAELEGEVEEMGTRLVIPYPDLGSHSPPGESQLNIIEQWASEFESVLVSVSSDAAHARLASEINNDISTLRYQSDQSIDDFQSLQGPRVLVLVNRPSGIDIRSSVCQIGIHLDLPYSTSGHESIAGEVESSGNVADASLAVRLSQLLGRLNRHPNDRSVHLILAGGLPLYRGSVFVKSLDPEIFLDILIGKRGVRRDYGLPNQQGLLEEVERFLDGEDTFRTQYLDAQEEARERYLQGGTEGFSPDANQLVEANLYLSRGNFSEAARIFESLARSAEGQGFNGEASFFDFQGLCCAMVDDVDTVGIFGRQLDTLIDRALQRNPPSDALVAAFRQAQPSTDLEADEAQREQTQISLRRQGLYHYQNQVAEYESELAGADLSQASSWTDYWRDRLTSPDHEALLDSYIELFQLLGTDTPEREIENNDAKIQWETRPGERFTIALEVKGWDETQRDSPSELKVDNIVQARTNAENIDADAVLLASSRRGYERDVPDSAEQREVTWFCEQTAIAIADLIAQHCATLHRVESRATGQDSIDTDALAMSSILMEQAGTEIAPADIRDNFGY